MDPDKISLWDLKCSSGMVLASRDLDKGAALPHCLHKLSGLYNPLQFSAKSNVRMEKAPALYVVLKVFFHNSVSGPASQQEDRLAFQKGIFPQQFPCDHEYNTVQWQPWEEKGAKQRIAE